MLQRLRDWWTIKTASPMSAAYDAALGRMRPGYAQQQARRERESQEWREREAAWWQRMLALQADGRVADAEAEIASPGAAMELSRFVLEPLERLANLYALDVERLLKLGDRAGAEAAARRADYWMGVWASHSTSGGEGTARSNEAARMAAELRGKLGKKE
jgi:hypothetical protein